MHPELEIDFISKDKNTITLKKKDKLDQIGDAFTNRLERAVTPRNNTISESIEYMRKHREDEQASEEQHRNEGITKCEQIIKNSKL